MRISHRYIVSAYETEHLGKSVLVAVMADSLAEGVPGFGDRRYRLKSDLEYLVRGARPRYDLIHFQPRQALA